MLAIQSAAVKQTQFLMASRGATLLRIGEGCGPFVTRRCRHARSHFCVDERKDFLSGLEGSLASREGCRMSKGRILKPFEKNGRGQSGLAAALPGQLHRQLACLLSWTIQQPPSTATLVRGAGETDWWTSTRSGTTFGHHLHAGLLVGNAKQSE